MSNDVNNLAHSFAAMARAFEELPTIKAQLEEAQASNERLSQTVGNREFHIMELKAEIEGLNKRNRELEVQRDDAELRFLELDEKANKAYALLSQASSHLETAKPQPEPVVSVQPDPTVQAPVETMASPIAGSTTVPAEAVPTQEQSSATQPSSLPQSSEAGQSAPNPTPAPTGEPSPAPPEGSSHHSAEGQSVADPMPQASGQSSSDGGHSISAGSSEPPSYANEPREGSTEEWYQWAQRMTLRYGHIWPERPAPVF